MEAEYKPYCTNRESLKKGWKPLKSYYLAALFARMIAAIIG
jgi:hypothetical protein